MIDNVLGTVGRCIYCGRTENLSKEHIIPYGLGASWLLRKASCKRHRDITSAFERDVLRNLWGPVRVALRMKTRHGHSNKRIDVVVTTESESRTITIDPARFGAPLLFPVFDSPLYLSGRNLAAPQNHLPVIHALPSIDFLRKEVGRAFGLVEGAKLAFTTTFNTRSFARMLAKLAHGFAIAKHGLPALKRPYLLEAIDTGHDVWNWVGCESDGRLLSTGYDDIDVRLSFINTPTRDIVAEIKLFGDTRAPRITWSSASLLQN